MTSKESLKESTKIFKEAIRLFEEISQIPENPDGTVLLPTSIQVKIGLLLGKSKKASMDKTNKEQTFICKGCQCELPFRFSLRTTGYCYLCDPNITVKELLANDIY